jgi:hypothetical protein
VRYIEHLEQADRPVLLVALADKVHNARVTLMDLRAAPNANVFWSRFNAPKDDQLWYYESLVDVFKRRLPGALTDELASVVAAIRALDAVASA